ncbi:MAG: hypothetical protein BAJATHORv1_30464 [Candidatus Thorarchaeota archaeon]|nr:MAG: hypothetical protein BAJATHORv1_30464 [Candidatus Thorarchaeota archaeon]
MTDFQLSEFEAVVFDLDSTLTDTASYPAKASLWILRHSTDDYEEIIKGYLPRLVKNYQKEIVLIVEGCEYKTPFECVRDATITTLEEYGIKPDPEVLLRGMDQFKSFHVEYSALQPATLELLEELQKRRIHLGIITNSWEGHAPIILEKLGIAEYFDSVIDPGTVKAYKPMSRIFERVVSDLNVSASKTVFIGDEFYADIVGASRFGMYTVWINRHNSILEEYLDIHGADFHPDLVITSLGDLLEYL